MDLLVQFFRPLLNAFIGSVSIQVRISKAALSSVFALQQGILPLGNKLPTTMRSHLQPLSHAYLVKVWCIMTCVKMIVLCLEANMQVCLNVQNVAVSDYFQTILYTSKKVHLFIPKTTFNIHQSPKYLEESLW